MTTQINGESTQDASAVIESAEGTTINNKLLPLFEALVIDIEKFFDKGQKAAGKRVRANSSIIGKELKLLRKRLSEVRAERTAEKEAAKA